MLLSNATILCAVVDNTFTLLHILIQENSTMPVDDADSGKGGLGAVETYADHFAVNCNIFSRAEKRLRRQRDMES